MFPLPPWLSLQVIGAAGIAILAFGGGMALEHRFDAAPLARAQAETANISAAYEAYKGRVTADAAKANADALAQRIALETAANALQAQLADTQRKADAKTKSLQALLAAAKPGEIREIGAAAGRYYAGLRQSQATGHTAPPGN